MSNEQTKLESIPEDPEPKVENPNPGPQSQTKVDEIKSEMKEKSPPKITNQTEDEELKTNRKRNQVNKKLSTMSKNTKEKQKNKPLRKPISTIPQRFLSKLLNINPMYLLGINGVIIAGISFWHQRKTYLQKEEEESDDEKDNQSPKKSSGGGGSNFFGPTPDDLRGESSSPQKKGKGKEQKKNDGGKSFNPFEWNRHQLGVWNFND